jgi:hypothetical protein
VLLVLTLWPAAHDQVTYVFIASFGKSIAHRVGPQVDGGQRGQRQPFLHEIVLASTAAGWMNLRAGPGWMALD